MMSSLICSTPRLSALLSKECTASSSPWVGDPDLGSMKMTFWELPDPPMASRLGLISVCGRGVDVSVTELEGRGEGCTGLLGRGVKTSTPRDT
jgi:hypothetical protein